MKQIVAACCIAAMLLVAGRAFAAEPDCDVPDYLLAGDAALNRVAAAAKQNHLRIVVIGTGSSLLAGPGGQQTAYPERFAAAMRKRLPQVNVELKIHARARQTAAEMVKEFDQVLAQDKPDLVIWQTGTIDAIRGVEPEEFRTVLDEGAGILQTGGADLILMNMQYSPRTETLIALGAYNDNMHWVAQERGAPLFDRLAIMQYWNEAGVFDLNAATKGTAMAQQVHDCIGRALASLVIEAARLEPTQEKATGDAENR